MNEWTNSLLSLPPKRIKTIRPLLLQRKVNPPIAHQADERVHWGGVEDDHGLEGRAGLAFGGGGHTDAVSFAVFGG